MLTDNMTFDLRGDVPRTDGAGVEQPIGVYLPPNEHQPATATIFVVHLACANPAEAVRHAHTLNTIAEADDRLALGLGLTGDMLGGDDFADHCGEYQPGGQAAIHVYYRAANVMQARLVARRIARICGCYDDSVAYVSCGGAWSEQTRPPFESFPPGTKWEHDDKHDEVDDEGMACA